MAVVTVCVVVRFGDVVVVAVVDVVVDGTGRCFKTLGNNVTFFVSCTARVITALNLFLVFWTVKPEDDVFLLVVDVVSVGGGSCSGSSGTISTSFCSCFDSGSSCFVIVDTVAVVAAVVVVMVAVRSATSSSTFRSTATLVAAATSWSIVDSSVGISSR